VRIPLVDDGARLLAQTCFDKPVLLEAGAGTGKTAALVARVVVWSLGPGWELAARDDASPHDTAASVLSGVVAITFTEAAAAEMATRIAADLALIARAETPEAYFSDAPLPPESERALRAKALIGALDHLTVRTIHAFCRRLLAAHPLEAGLHPELEVDADAVRVDAIARDAIEARVARSLSAVLDADLAALADAGIGPSALHEALVQLLAEGARPEDFAEELLGPRATSEFAREIASLAQRILAIEAGGLAGSRASTSAAACEQLRGLVRDLAALRERDIALAELAPLCARDWSSTASKLTTWARGDDFGAAETECFGDRAPEVAECSRRLRDGLRQLADMNPPALAAARRLVEELLDECQLRLRAAGIATFGALLRDAHALVRARPEVAARVRRDIRQLLVDEFQDTDALQCELIETIAFEGEARPALFLVGDPKQSIYGWRNADLAAYERMRQRVRDAGGAVEQLVVNRRSTQAVLDEVGRLVAPVMIETPELQPSYEPLQLHPRRAPPRPLADGQAAIEHWLSFARAADGSIENRVLVGRASRLEAEALARDLLRLRAHGAALGKVAVLMRNTTGFEPVLSALRRAGVAFVVERETKHGERRELVEARAFLRCVLDPHDQLALVAALRAPAVGVPDAALVPLWRRDFPKLAAELGGDDGERLASLERVVQETAAAMPAVPGAELLAGFAPGLIAFLRGLAELRRCFATASPERFVERLREVWLLEAAEASRFLGAHRVASVDRLLRDLVAALEDADGSAAGLLAALHRSGTIAREHEEGRPRAIADDAVQVMTIHRAKGLEFDHVYLLQGHREDPNAPDRETRVHRGRGRRAFELLGMPSPSAWQARIDQTVLEKHERVRLLYVAATRARERLVVGWSRRPGNAPEPEAARSFADLLTNRGDPRRRAQAAIDAGGAVRDEHGALWRALDWQEAPALPRAAGSSGALEVARIDADVERLRAAREVAERAESRPWHLAASELAHTTELREGEDARGEDAAEEPTTRRAPDAPDRARRIAMAAGTAVHAALEHASFDASGSDLRSHGEAAIEGALASVEPADERAEAAQRARAIWARACAGRLLAKLRALEPSIVARELPVLLAPSALPASDDAPVGFVSGAIDLLYRDEGGQYVVADYKTDEAESEVKLAELAAKYAPQGAAYTRAVQLALGLTTAPRFELWFLQAGEVRATGA